MELLYSTPITITVTAALLFALHTGSTRVLGEIRCHCNDASCVPTGYMCKSPAGRCFSRLSLEAPPVALPARGDVTSSLATHGCVETLTTRERRACGGGGGEGGSGGGGGGGGARERRAAGDGGWPVVVCCAEDMCNDMNSLDTSVYVQAAATGRGNDTSRQVARDADGDSADVRYRLATDDAALRRRADLWFKAAVIGVPIAGGFILVLLVLLAVRMLRHDQRRHRRLLRVTLHERSLTKAQHYVADHFRTAPNVAAERHRAAPNVAERAQSAPAYGAPPNFAERQSGAPPNFATRQLGAPPNFAERQSGPAPYAALAADRSPARDTVVRWGSPPADSLVVV